MSGRGSENKDENTWNLDVLDTQKQCVFIWGVAQITILSIFQKTSPNILENVFEIVQKSITCRSGCIVEKTTQNNAKNNVNCTKNHHQRVSHERWFRIIMCIWACLWARWAPRPSPHIPKTSPNNDCCSFVSLLVWFVIDSWCIFPKIARRCWCSFLCFREWTFNETCKWNKQWTPFQKGTVAGLRAALLDFMHKDL